MGGIREDDVTARTLERRGEVKTMPQRARRQSLLKHTDIPAKRKISKQERIAIERHANMKRMAEDVATDSTDRARLEKLMAKEMVKIEALQAASQKELDDDLAAKA